MAVPAGCDGRHARGARKVWSGGGSVVLWASQERVGMVAGEATCRHAYLARPAWRSTPCCCSSMIVAKSSDGKPKQLQQEQPARHCCGL